MSSARLAYPVEKGMKLSVYWEDDQTWYDVDVKRSRAAKAAADPGAREWLLEYDDGATECGRGATPCERHKGSSARVANRVHRTT